MQYPQVNYYQQGVGRRASSGNITSARNNLFRSSGASQTSLMDMQNPQSRQQPFSSGRYESGWSVAHNEGQAQSHVPNQRQWTNSRTVNPPPATFHRPGAPKQQQNQMPQMQIPAPITIMAPVMGPDGKPGANTIAPKDLEGNPNVKYVTLNWEDILGGKDAMKQMQVKMAPPVPGAENQNRQMHISFGNNGGGGNAQPAGDGGYMPVKVVAFEPIKDYPGLKATSGEDSGYSAQGQQQSGQMQAPRQPMAQPQYQQMQRPPQTASRSGQPMPMGQRQMQFSRGQVPQQRPQSYAPQGRMAPRGQGNACKCAACAFKQPTRR